MPESLSILKSNERPQAILQALTKRGFSQLKIGEEIGLHQTQVGRLLDGTTKDMKATPYMRLYSFAQKCGVLS